MMNVNLIKQIKGQVAVNGYTRCSTLKGYAVIFLPFWK